MIAMADRRKAKVPGAAPDVLVRFGSIMLMEFGHQLAWEMVRELLASFGYVVSASECKPSDLHLCVDMLRPAKDYCAAMVGNCYVTYATQWRAFNENREFVGFEVGNRSGIQLGCYNKLKELADKPSPESEKKRQILERYRWDGVQPEHCTRLEFRVKRKELRELMEVDTLEDLFKKLPTIAKYLTIIWFRLTEERPDRENGNQQRSTESPLWGEVREAFQAWTGKQVAADERPALREPISFEALLTQAQGVMASAIARSCLAPPRLASVLRDMAACLERDGENYVATLQGLYGPGRKEAKLQRRRARIRARIGEYDHGGSEVALC